MKTLKNIILICLLTFLTSSLWSQQLIFCTQVDKNGQPTGQSTSFKVEPAGSLITIMYQSAESFNTDEIIFEMYLNGRYVGEMVNKVKKDWTFFYQELTFSLEGEYTIYALDKNKKEITFDKLTIVHK